MDNLSREHFRTVWAEIQGRFFSEEEAQQLKAEIEKQTVTDPQTRLVAAQAWGVVEAEVKE